MNKKIKFSWDIKIGESSFYGKAQVDTFEELDTLIENLKATIDIITPPSSDNKELN